MSQRLRARRGPPAERTGALISAAGIPLERLDAETEAALVRILADALVADFIDERRHDGRFPVGTRPNEGEGD
jgi:hypothetical protein